MCGCSFSFPTTHFLATPEALFIHNFCFAFPQHIHFFIMYTEAFRTYQEQYYCNRSFNRTNCNASHGDRQNWCKCDDKYLNHGLKRIRISIIIQCSTLALWIYNSKKCHTDCYHTCGPSKYKNRTLKPEISEQLLSDYKHQNQRCQ